MSCFFVFSESLWFNFVFTHGERSVGAQGQHARSESYWKINSPKPSGMISLAAGDVQD
jgi:hypothetical protein